MAKKKHRKKHQFRHQTTAETAGTVAQVQEAKPPAVVAATKSGTIDADLRHVGGDVKRVVVLAGLFIVLQIVLWYLMQRTSLGNLYRLIQL